jgi:hypothetical protein
MPAHKWTFKARFRANAYAMQSGRATANLTIFRQIAKKYLNRDPREILRDLIETQPPQGKWFAAAKDAGCLGIALECATDGWAEPATLIRAYQQLASAAAMCGRSEWAAAEVDRLIDQGTSSDRQELLKVLVAERSRQSSLD